MGILSNTVRFFTNSFLRQLRLLKNQTVESSDIFVLTDQADQFQLNALQQMLSFYVPGKKVVFGSHLSWPIILSPQPILVFQTNIHHKRLNFYRGGIFDIDVKRNFNAASRFARLAEYCEKSKTYLQEAHQRFNILVKNLKKQGMDKAYVFGTGPSLERATERDWSDGYRIVCNTIVRDPHLWKHLNPQIIVAGDPIYHFSDTQFARAFRSDLCRRLSETDTYFIYPSHYHQIASRELSEFSARLIPIPTGKHDILHVNLAEHFFLPQLGNVLPYLLLPAACTLSQNVYLWGFDGRAPNDQLFWANSTKHSYPELLPGLQTAFPAFFDHHVPADNPSKYVNAVHGDVLETRLRAAERSGWSFHMLHESWTPTLQKRYGGDKTLRSNETDR